MKMDSRREKGRPSAIPSGLRQCGCSACSLGAMLPIDFAPAGSHTHPGSQICKEDLLLGHAKAQGGARSAANKLSQL